ncbi:unnamed protein product, partial [Discosporangium mesarthrocarpum]
MFRLQDHPPGSGMWQAVISLISALTTALAITAAELLIGVISLQALKHPRNDPEPVYREFDDEEPVTMMRMVVRTRTKISPLDLFKTWHNVAIHCVAMAIVAFATSRCSNRLATRWWARRIVRRGNPCCAQTLIKAVATADLPTVQALLRARASPRAALDDEQKGPLHHAACTCSPRAVAIVNSLLEAGADPNQQDQWGRTPLHYASRTRMRMPPVKRTTVRKRRKPRGWGQGWGWWGGGGGGAIDGGSGAVTGALLHGGAATGIRGQDGMTALHHAAHKGVVGAVLELVAAGADLEVPDNYGATALHSACYMLNAGCVELLLRGGADEKAVYG